MLLSPSPPVPTSPPGSNGGTGSPDEMLSSSSCDYLVQAFKGEGCFGKVAQCLKLDTNSTVAFKILKKTPYALWEAEEEVDHMRFIMETQGQPEEHLLDAGTKTSTFFSKDPDSMCHGWRLKTPVEYSTETGIQSEDSRGYIFSSLEDMIMLYPDAWDEAENEDLWWFMELQKWMLHLDPDLRIDPADALKVL